MSVAVCIENNCRSRRLRHSRIPANSIGRLYSAPGARANPDRGALAELGV
jgi:hypothetical protein